MMDKPEQERLAALDAMTDWDLGPEPVPPGPLTPVPRGGAGAAVDGGALVVLSAAVSEGHGRDVLHSVLLAQLVANKKYDRHAEAENWYRSYGETLERVGWVIKEHEGLARHKPRKFPYRLGPVILKVLARISDAPSVERVTAALKVLTALPDDDPAAKLFEKESHVERAGNFQVVAVDEAAGLVTMQLARFRFRVEDEATEIGRLLRTEFHAGAEVFRGSQILDLNDEVYGPLRDGVAAKLGARADALIAPVGGPAR
ncbi:hypothetical protein [Streptomyces spectabilis]|uniref:Uncharacterized protein n=1 Tax=Streptomyces spectabilis TaxID=68270 RepID=A0A5P2XKS4_STRST|nr:hypothetical protein [Streptomyces spectabilis]MBB5105651.1 hypothetical protein [Streptomyces spectabilis]MCI3906825.1 hypothetical protein [Streptomyces spectabilis]QEV63620.1 hypothetical protein CP982_37095 [Streptomyces spectabilis]GGV22989.1 hypothetical protein GCM10010245_38560 [Streptomyces spectabilis]